MNSIVSTAFLQQCFAMHRMDLAVKRIKGAGIIVFCRQCRIRHTLRVDSWPPGVAGASSPFVESLLRCATDHLTAIQVHAVDVVREYLDLVCAECRSTHAFRIAECVTRSSQDSSST